MMNRRQACRLLGASVLFPTTLARAEAAAGFRPRYVLASALYGDMDLDTVLGEVRRAGCEAVDIWRKPHGDQREQIAAMGDEAFQRLLERHDTRMAISTCYPLGPFGRDEEMAWVKRNGGEMTVCATGRMGDELAPRGAEARRQVKAFFERLEPHIDLAEELGVTMAFENHGNSMMAHPDSIRYFVEFNPSERVGIAFAPHHLTNHLNEIPALIRDIGADQLPFIYFQEHSEAASVKMDKEIELQQLPGFGTLDYVPILEALRDIRFTGYAEIFMHPVPRGVPMLDTAAEITAAVNRSRAHIDDCLARLTT